MRSMTRSARHFFIAIALIGVICFLISSRLSMLPKRDSQTPGEPASKSEKENTIVLPDAGYVGSQICGDCHAEIMEKYVRSPMGRSLAEVNHTSGPQEDYEQKTSFQQGHCEYRIERNGDRVWHHEILSDDRGVIYDQKEEIQYAMGSNTRGRSYLLWREGAFFVSPITWYANTGWDLSPGYDPDHHFRFSRRALDGCITCHCGQMARSPDRTDYAPPPVFYEISIGCERCHGPGKSHVEFRQSASAAGEDPLIDLKQLPPAERDAVCYQCHFQGKERILRSGRHETDFRPGMKLGEIWTVFVNGDGAEGDTTAVVSQTMQMQSSRCFQASAGKLGCVSCHDPHDSPEENQRASFYDRRCVECHQDVGCKLASSDRDAAPANGSCIHCHMPSLKAKEVPHTSQTDHRIPRHSGLEKSNPVSTPWAIFEEEGLTLPESERIRAIGLMSGQLAQSRNDRAQAENSLMLLRQVQKALPEDDAIPLTIGKAYEVVGRPDKAVETWKTLIQKSPHHAEALLNLANIAFKTGRYLDASQYYERTARIEPLHVVMMGRWTYALVQLGKTDAAIRVAEQALKQDPSFAPVYVLLADAYSASGNPERSRELKTRAERLSAQLTKKTE